MAVDSTVRVRFAPSPTGKLHIGGARTAIYNWAFARAMGGTFVLRIEDTDPERSTEENTQLILRAMRWLDLDWDEGPEIGGAHGPYFQTQRFETYTAALERLKERKAVYPCFCTKEQLDAKRAAAEKNGGSYTGYDRTCRNLDPAEAQARIEAGEPHVWRLKVPLDHGPINFDDAVYGSMSFPADVMDDMILMRADGTPTYNFAVVCDDANMGISHVIRGDDHLSNTPRQILIYEALGLTPPTFAHLSMILGPDGKKLSKRHGATSVEEYKAQGFLPDTMVNFLALLGWSLDGETTIISRETLCREFSLDRVTKKDAIFDEKKLEWMNGQYIKALDADTWVELSRPWLASAYIQGKQFVANAARENLIAQLDEHIYGENENQITTTSQTLSDNELAPGLADIDERPEWYTRLFPLVAERETHLTDAAEKFPYMFWEDKVNLDAKSVKKVLLKEGSRADEALRACREVLANSTQWEYEVLQEACRALCEPMELKPKALFQPLRVAVCGNMVSPPLFESIELLPKSDVLARIDFTLDAMAALSQ